MILASGCGRAHANKQTLITDNCGVSWKLVQPGSTLPAMIGPCSYKVTVPDFPMQGETKFKISFKDRVLASVEVAYEYSIVDALKFIGEAKYLGKSNSEGDDSTNSASAGQVIFILCQTKQLKTQFKILLKILQSKIRNKSSQCLKLLKKILKSDFRNNFQSSLLRKN